MKAALLHRLSHYVNAWQRNRPRAIRGTVMTFLPIPGQPRPQQLIVLCEPDKFTDGLWSAWSWLRFLHEDLQLHLFVDGAISPAHQRAFEQLFPGAQLSSVPSFLADHPVSPSFQTFIDHHRFARKLAILMKLQETTDCLYSDCDVLAFRRPDEIVKVINRGSPNAYIVDPAARHDRTYVDPWISKRAAELSLSGVPDINGGLLWIARGSLDAELVERLLVGWTPEVNGHFAEQTILGVLFAANGATPLPEADYLVSGQGMHFWQDDLDCGRLTVRHYVGNVRHRMYAHAFPYIAAQARRQSGL